MWQTAWVSSKVSFLLQEESMFRNGQRDDNTGLLEQVTLQPYMYSVSYGLGYIGLPARR
jgi:hypothetical protein